jgi:hypothetical protein
MRTTRAITTELLRQATKKAGKEGTPLRREVEPGIRFYLAKSKRHIGYKLRWRTERGRLLPGLGLDDESWVLPWPCVYKFLRGVTYYQVFDPLTELDSPRADLESLLEAPIPRPLGRGTRTPLIPATWSVPPESATGYGAAIQRTLRAKFMMSWCFGLHS